LTTGTFFGDLPGVAFGNPNTPFNDHQKYTAIAAQTGKRIGDHDIRFGWNYLKTKVDGVVTQILDTQLFATTADFATYGPINAGFFTVTTAGGLTPEANELHLNNDYNGLFAQDDWKIRNNLTVNLGIRWDHDSEFKINTNFSPRLGVVWGITPKTVIRSHFGIFYDNFRLGLASLVPEFGGADRRIFQPFSYPRGFYGVPTMVVGLVNGSLFPPNGMCVSTSLTDAQITTAGATCPTNPSQPYVGVDRLNRVVASGHAFIPANSPINLSNIQSLSGLSPDQYLTAAAAAVGMPNGFFFWGPFGVLTHGAVPAQPLPTAVDADFATPSTVQFSVGVAHEIGRDMFIEADYHHRKMRDILGLRQTNLGFRARVQGRAGSFDPPFTGGPITTYGPYYEGNYDALVLNFQKRLSNRYTFGASYTFADATDNSLGVSTLPSDSFVGVVPVVTEASTGHTNASAPFTAVNGNFVAQAGTFVNGPDLDKGPSDLSLRHVFQANGLVELPWQIQISAIFRAQSGYRFSRNANPTEDPDGQGTFNLIDHTAGRNAFTAPSYANLDARFAKRFDLGERVKLHVLFEFFNVFNRQNPAAVESNAQSTLTPFGKATQVLPGREGQFGIRIEF
jgi:outer membrane receptor protein involved in Fe transport